LQAEWEKQKSQLADLVVEINKPLKKLDRATLITLCTIDVHARDVLGRLIEERVEDATCFQWQSQLRYIQHEKTKKCQVPLDRRRKLLQTWHWLVLVGTTGEIVQGNV
jgi:dynein heavy chain, axonemal